jgi:hypothetical protein
MRWILSWFGRRYQLVGLERGKFLFEAGFDEVSLPTKITHMACQVEKNSGTFIKDSPSLRQIVTYT